jgi:hypothetical protein
MMTEGFARYLPQAIPGWCVLVDNKGKVWWRQPVIVDIEFEPAYSRVTLKSEFEPATVKAKVKPGKARNARIEYRDMEDKTLVAQPWMYDIRRGYTIHLHDGRLNED